jgi:hypothetical protein
MDSAGSEYGSVTDIYEYGNELSGSMKCRDYLYELSEYQLLCSM